MRIKSLFLIAIIIVVGGCASSVTMHQPDSWRLVYSHDGEGNTLAGSKENLITAVREGKPIRIYWAGRRVEHSSDAIFTTILGGEVFTQTPEIRGQAPSLDPPEITKRENSWQGLFATNGKRGLKWFVQD